MEWNDFPPGDNKRNNLRKNITALEGKTYAYNGRYYKICYEKWI